MAKFVQAKFTGDIAKGLDGLMGKAGESLLRSGGFAGADLIRNQAVANAPFLTGTLKRNIIVKRLEEKSNANLRQTYIVVIRKGKYNQEGDAFYGNFVEEGHRIVGRRAGKMTMKAHRELELAEFGNRRVAARPFMRPAWESLKGTVLEVMRAQMRKKLQELRGAGDAG